MDVLVTLDNTFCRMDNKTAIIVVLSTVFVHRITSEQISDVEQARAVWPLETEPRSKDWDIAASCGTSSSCKETEGIKYV